MRRARYRLAIGNPHFHEGSHFGLWRDGTEGLLIQNIFACHNCPRMRVRLCAVVPSRRQNGRAGGKKKPSARGIMPAVPTEPGPNDPYDIVYFRRHADDDPTQTAPGKAFLERCPDAVASKFYAVLPQIAKAPPHKFSGGGCWEAMHDTMAGFYEVRFNGPLQIHYRLFCLLDKNAEGRGPLLVVIDGAWKPFRTVLPERRYEKLRQLRREYLARNPRSLD